MGVRACGIPDCPTPTDQFQGSQPCTVRLHAGIESRVLRPAALSPLTSWCARTGAVYEHFYEHYPESDAAVAALVSRITGYVGALLARYPDDVDHGADSRPVVFWRPGCKCCIRLRIRLGRSARQSHWVNIWRDTAGAAAVRAANDGNETVPTVVAAGQPHTTLGPG